MNILLFKKDLDQYPNGQIQILAKYYKLDANINDLRWLIAIRHTSKVQMPVEDPNTLELVFEKLDDNSLGNICMVNGYHDLCMNEWTKRYPSLVKSTPGKTWSYIKQVKEIQEWLQQFIDYYGDKEFIEGIDTISDINDIPNITRIFITYYPDFKVVVPESISILKNLTELELSSVELEHLPSSIGELKSLTELILTENKLVNLPSSIANLDNLEILHLGYNQLRSLPKDIGRLQALEELILDHNQLESIPVSIGNLKNLRELSLSSNKLKSLPDTIGDLMNLTDLYLNTNKLRYLPKSIIKLTNLDMFDIDNNPISYNIQ